MANENDRRRKAVPPWWADQFLRWYCTPRLLDEIQGDLHEAFHARAQKYGLTKARWLFIKEVAQFFKPSYIKKSIINKNLCVMPGLVPNYLKVAFRNVVKNKSFSMINIIGLAIGMAAFILIMQYVRFERSYDRFHHRAQYLYRITHHSTGSEGQRQSQATTYPGVGRALKDELPEVQSYARLIHHEKIMPPAVLSVERQDGSFVKFREEKMYFADASFLKMFSFPAVAGDAATALERLNSVVLTVSAARKYFGSESPLGKTLMFDGDRPLTVTAVLANVPENSHLQFEVLLSYAILQQEDEKNNNDLFSAWEWPVFYTYVQVDEDARPEAIEEKLLSVVEKYSGSKAPPKRTGVELGLQPVTAIHLQSDLIAEIAANSSSNLLGFLMIIAMVILCVALINYSNLTTAKAVERAKEVALRKSIGASQGSVVSQFLLESLVLNGLGVLLGLGLIGIAAPYFNQLIGKEVMANGWWQMKHVWKVLAYTFGASCLVAGLYPAFLVSSFKPHDALKGRFSMGKRGLQLRRMLVMFQFAVTVSLVAVTLTVYQQISFMQNKGLGYAADQLLIIKAPTLIKDMQEIARKAEVFKNTVRQQVAVEALTVTNEVPGRVLTYSMPVRKASSSPENNVPCYWISTDEHFLETFQTKLVAGRNFMPSDSSPVLPQSENKIMLNERAVQMLGFADAEEALQQEVVLWDKTAAEIIGVVENFHQRSLRESYDPLIFQFPTYYQTLYFTMRMNKDQQNAALQAIAAAYEEVFSDNPFEFFFLDSYFNRQYQAEQRFSTVIFVFSCLAIFIACLGLMGLTSLISFQKTKEIGIRKTFGASVNGIIGLLSFPFVRLVVLASLMALPLTYIGLQRWLSTYAFHIDLQLWGLLTPVLVVLAVTLLSIGFQTMHAAIKNPVDSLRYE